MATRPLLLCEWRPEAIVFGEVVVARGQVELRALERVDARGQDAGEAVRELVARAAWTKRSVVLLQTAGRPEHHILLTPPGSSAETALLVEAQLAERLADPLSGYLLRTVRLAPTVGDGGKPRTRTLAALLPTSELEAAIAALTGAGLALAGVATVPLALLAAAGARPAADEVLVHLDHQGGSLVRVDPTGLRAVADVRYGAGGDSADPGVIAAAVDRALAQVMEEAERPAPRLRLTGWEATSEVFEALAAAGHDVDAVAAPPIDAAAAGLDPEQLESFVYAHAALLWCALGALPCDLTPRALRRPARIRRLVALGVAAAALYAGAIGGGAAVAARRRDAVEAAVAARAAETARLQIDPALTAAHAEAQRRLRLLGQLHAPTPDLGGLLSALSLAAGERTALTSVSVLRSGSGEHRGEIAGRAYGLDAAGAQAEFDRFAAALRLSRAVGAVSVRELELVASEPPAGPGTAPAAPLRGDLAVAFIVDLVVAPKEAS